MKKIEKLSDEQWQAIYAAREETRKFCTSTEPASGLHRTYIGAVETGKRNLTLLNLAKIAGALDMTFAAFAVEIENIADGLPEDNTLDSSRR